MPNRSIKEGSNNEQYKQKTSRISNCCLSGFASVLTFARYAKNIEVATLNLTVVAPAVTDVQDSEEPATEATIAPATEDTTAPVAENAGNEETDETLPQNG